MILLLKDLRPLVSITHQQVVCGGAILVGHGYLPVTQWCEQNLIVAAGLGRIVDGEEGFLPRTAGGYVTPGGTVSQLVSALCVAWHQYPLLVSIVCSVIGKTEVILRACA